LFATTVEPGFSLLGLIRRKTEYYKFQTLVLESIPMQRSPELEAPRAERKQAAARSDCARVSSLF
jgi:hypothetical protein